MPLYETQYASLSPCQPRCLEVPRPSDLTSRPARTGLLSTGSPEADRCLGAVAPGIEQHDARRLEVSGVTGDDGQAVRRGSGGDESVPVSLRVGDEHPRATPGDRYVDSQDATHERGKDLMLHPVPEHPCALSRRSTRRMPISSSMTVMTEMYMAAGSTDAAQLVTLGSARPVPALRSSDTTFVSRRFT